MKISQKLVIYFILAASLGIVITSVIIYEFTSSVYEEQQFLQLEQVGEIRVERINNIFNTLTSDIKTSQDYLNLKKNIPILEQYRSDPTSLEYLQAKKELSSQLLPLDDEKEEITNIIITDTKGEIIFVTKEDVSLGQQLPDPDNKAFILGKTSVNITKVFKNPEKDNDLFFLVSAPIFHEEDFVGVIVFEVNMRVIYNVLLDSTGLGTSGENLLGEKQGEYAVFLNPLKYTPNAALNLKVGLSEERAAPIRQAVQGIENFGYSVDYRPEPIVAVWRYMEVPQWGLVVKIDTAEAFAELEELQRNTVIISLSLIGAIAVTGVVVTRQITRPIEKLQSMAKRIQEGDLDVKLDVKGKDEISQLSSMMNDTVKKLKQEKKEKDNVFKALDESTITAITDKKGAITYANKKFEDISKYTEEELLDKNHRILKSGHHPDSFFNDMWGTISKGKAWHGVVKNVAKDGSFYWVNTVITPFLDEDGKPEQYMAIRMDMTKQKELEEQLADSLKQVEIAQKEKEEFVAMITHDLKQPLVPIKGNADLLKMPDMGELNEMQKECVDEIAANASRQLSMIDNLVSAQKLGLASMKYKIEELSTKEILKDCIRTHSPIMQDKNIEYFDSSTEDFKIKGDMRRILEAFTNLIQNAHDFVPDDGKIEVGVLNGQNEVTFFVKDNGEGIPKEKQDQLFKKYGQVDSNAERKFGGTGLGLAVSQELIEGMKGRIWVESEKGKGTTFLFTIPKVE